MKIGEQKILSYTYPCFNSRNTWDSQKETPMSSRKNSSPKITKAKTDGYRCEYARQGKNMRAGRNAR